MDAKEYSQIPVGVKLFKSRRFWILVVDLVVSLATFFITKYTNPQFIADATFLIASIQPVILAVIAAFTYEDVEQAKLSLDREVLAKEEK